jgi:hypothetical protein
MFKITSDFSDVLLLKIILRKTQVPLRYAKIFRSKDEFLKAFSQAESEGEGKKKHH